MRGGALVDDDLNASEGRAVIQLDKGKGPSPLHPHSPRPPAYPQRTTPHQGLALVEHIVDQPPLEEPPRLSVAAAAEREGWCWSACHAAATPGQPRPRSGPGGHGRAVERC